MLLPLLTFTFSTYNTEIEHQEVLMYKDKFQAVGALVPKICMPKPGIDLKTWAVVACDQFTSEAEYWEETQRLVGDAPSTLHLIFPERYLEDSDAPQRISRIHDTMGSYLSSGILQEQEEAIHLVQRTPIGGEPRWGIMLCLDLEQYDYSPDSTTLVRATEGTIIERIPPRLEVRRDAPVELPHILVLIDDPQKLVIEPLVRHLDQCDEIYHVDLIQGGGTLRGYRVTSPLLLDRVANGLNLLAGEVSDSPDKQILYAVGDGNHSLATAKASWEEIKQQAADPDDIMDHPARWALVEIENIHDPGLVFEPIHRVLFQVDRAQVESHFSKVCDLWEYVPCSSIEHMQQLMNQGREESHVVGTLWDHSYGCYVFHNPTHAIPVGTLQDALDGYLSQDSRCTIDYIHGEDSTRMIGGKPGNMGFFLPAIDKFTFFHTIEADGALPRKTFSMGEAVEKRYYLEARKIIP